MSLMLHEMLVGAKTASGSATAMPGQLSAAVSEGGIILTTQRNTTATAANIYRSADKGATWTTVLTVAGGFNCVVFDEAGSEIALATSRGSATGSGAIHRSTDGGLTWTTVLSGMNATGASAANGAVFLNGNFAIASDLTPNGGRKFYYSSDAGLTWTQSATTIGATTGDSIKDCYLFATGEGLMVANSTAGPTLIHIRRSTDFGVTWPTNLMSGTVFGPAGVYGCEATGVAFARDTTGVYRSTDKGATWSLVTLPFAVGVNVPISRRFTSEWYGAEQVTGAIWKSTDNGLTWSVVIPAIGTGPGGINSISINSSGLGVVLLSTNFAYVFQV